MQMTANAAMNAAVGCFRYNRVPRVTGSTIATRIARRRALFRTDVAARFRCHRRRRFQRRTPGGRDGVPASAEPAATRRPRLLLAHVALVLRRHGSLWPTYLSSSRVPIGSFGRRVQHVEGQLADSHPRPQLDRQGGDVREFQRDLPTGPAGVHEAGGRVDEQPESSEARLPSTLATRSSGGPIRSSDVPSTNSPGCSTNASPSATTTFSIRSDGFWNGSMTSQV